MLLVVPLVERCLRHTLWRSYTASAFNVCKSDFCSFLEQLRTSMDLMLMDIIVYLRRESRHESTLCYFILKDYFLFGANK